MNGNGDPSAFARHFCLAFVGLLLVIGALKVFNTPSDTAGHQKNQFNHSSGAGDSEDPVGRTESKGGLPPDLYYADVSSHDCSKRYESPGSVPDFLLIGVQKGGSTALYSYLQRHGNVRPAICKEIHFFDDTTQFARGKRYYLQHFPSINPEWRGKVVTGEGSPSYLRDPTVPDRLRRMIPSATEMKFLVMLRDPATRFKSHWVGRRLAGLDIGLLTCNQTWTSYSGEINRCLSTNSLTKCQGKFFDNPVARGLYLPQLERWTKYFRPENFMIVQSEAMLSDVEGTLQAVAKFLGIRPFNERELQSLKTAYTGSNHRSSPAMTECDASSEDIKSFYGAFNPQLKSYLKGTFRNLVLLNDGDPSRNWLA